MFSRSNVYRIGLYQAPKNASTRRNRSSKVPPEVKEYIHAIRGPLDSKKNVKRLIDRFHISLKNGLGGKQSSLRCLNTYVQDFPSGLEKGKFLALDLGGTNFRSMLVELTDTGENASIKKEMVSEKIRSSSGYELFEFMATLTHDHLKEKGQNIEKHEFPTVLTFSFPVNQTAINEGTIVSFSKGYNCKKVIGKNLGSLLVDAFAKVGVKIKLYGIINDTVGTMLANRWTDPLTAGGIVIGTGTNACYTEKIKSIENFVGDPEKPLVVINTEWGAFGDSGELDFIRTPFDLMLDDQSNNPGKHIMEKMVSGMYMGEICRQALMYLAKKNMLCSNRLYDVLSVPNSFPSSIISKLEEEEIAGNCILCKPIKKYYRQKSILDMLNQELYGDNKCNEEKIKVQDFHIINSVCQAVAERGAHLIGIAIACLAQRIDNEDVVFGIDGSLYEKTISYKKIIPQTVDQLLSDKVIKLSMVHDGSIRGAAYLAAVLYHKEKEIMALASR